MSSFVDQLNSDIKQAMRDKNKLKLSTLRLLKSALQNEQIKSGAELTDEEVLSVLTRETKQRKESLVEFEQAGRQELVENTQMELEFLYHYLPRQLTEDEIESVVVETIREVNATSKADMGKVMGAIMPKIKGIADGNVVKKMVEEQLS